MVIGSDCTGSCKDKNKQKHGEKQHNKRSDNANSQIKPGVRPGDRFTKVIVNRKSIITLKIFLRARIRAFH